jgi:hypothetical protein
VIEQPAVTAPSPEGVFNFWLERMARHVGAADERAHAGATAAFMALQRGAQDDAALREGRKAAGLYPRPGLEFYRNPVRVALLVLLSGGFYQLWWLWETFALGVRERFPHGRALPWILIPIYNLVVIYQNAADLRAAEQRYAGSSGLQPWLMLILMPVGLVAARIFFPVGLPVLAVAAYLNQTSINRYLAARYPESRPTINAGEIVFAVLGIGLTLLAIVGFLSSGH